MQRHEFSTGGYVIHKAYLSTTKYSVWFDAAGQFTEAERFDRLGRAYPVRKGTATAQRLQRVYGGRP